MAVSTPAFQPQKADEGKVVVPANRLVAARAVRGWGENRFIARDAAYADIEEAAKDQSSYRQPACQKRSTESLQSLR